MPTRNSRPSSPSPSSACTRLLLAGVHAQPMYALEENRLGAAQRRAAERGLERDSLHARHESNRAVRDGKWKLVAKGQDGPWELYDVEADRSELHDLSPSNAERVRQMSDAWQHWAEASQVLPLGTWRRKEQRN